MSDSPALPWGDGAPDPLIHPALLEQHAPELRRAIPALVQQERARRAAEPEPFVPRFSGYLDARSHREHQRQRERQHRQRHPQQQRQRQRQPQTQLERQEERMRQWMKAMLDGMRDALADGDLRAFLRAANAEALFPAYAIAGHSPASLVTLRPEDRGRLADSGDAPSVRLAAALRAFVGVYRPVVLPDPAAPPEEDEEEEGQLLELELGRFETEEEAAQASDRAELYYEYATPSWDPRRLNFDVEDYFDPNDPEGFARFLEAYVPGEGHPTRDEVLRE